MTRSGVRSVGPKLSLVVLCLGAPGAAVASDVARDAAAMDQAVASVVDGAEPRVVQLRHLGAGVGDALAAASTIVTGWRLLGSDGTDSDWVVASDYALAETRAATLCRFAEGETVEARLIARDYGRRLALFWIGDDEPQRAPVAPRGRRARVGESAIALGRVAAGDEVTLSVGGVSAVGRLGGRAVQTDALVSPTNYGGPLLGLDGALLGVLTPLGPDGDSGVEYYDSGVAFAITAEQVAIRLAVLARGVDIHPGWLGLSVSGRDPLRRPATVSDVAEGGPAEDVGVRGGDIITAVGDRETPTAWALRAAVAGLDAGREVAVRVDRDGESVELLVTPQRPPEEPEEDDETDDEG